MLTCAHTWLYCLCRHGWTSEIHCLITALGTVGSLIDARSTAGVLPTGRLLRRRWIRRGRRSRLRSLLLRRHVDEVDEDLARVNAGSSSHNLDAPYLARQ